MAIMTREQQDDWLANHRRQRREQIALWKRSQIRLLFSRGITPLERPVWYRKRQR